MAPRPRPTTSKAGSSKLSGLPRTSANGAGPSRVAVPSYSTKKRPAQQVEDEDDEDDEDFVPNGAQLELGEEDDEGDSQDGEADEDDDEEAFPELDSGSEADADDEEGAVSRIDGDETEDDEEELLDDEETGSESGYNSSDIDAMGDDDEEDDASSSTSLSPSASSSKADMTTDEKLSKMIAKNSIKPNDEIGTDARISSAKQGHGKLVRSKLVEGGYKREYEDVEAGYGSESSTEDVSGRSSCRCSHSKELMIPRTQTRSAMCLSSGTMIFHISDTT